MATSVPVPEIPAPPETDKGVHLLMYAVLAFLCWRALAARLSVRRRVLCVVAGASLFGALDEVHQRFIPGRTADPRDWTADTLGAALGAGAALRALTRRDASSQNTE